MKTRFTILLLLLATTMMAQELKVKAFYHDAEDLSARRYKVVDANGEPCALVKVGLVIPNAVFTGDILETVAKTSEYWVYFTEGSTYIKVNAPGTLPLNYDFEIDGEKIGLRKSCTYVLTLEVPNVPANNIPQPQVTPTEPERKTEPIQTTTENSTPTVSIPKIEKSSSERGTVFYVQPSVQFGSFTGIGASIGLNLSNFNIEVGGTKGLGKEEYYAYYTDGTELGKSSLNGMSFEGRLGYRIVASGFSVTPQVGASMLTISDGLLVENANALSGIAGARLAYNFTKNFAIFASPSFSFKLSESDGYKSLSNKIDCLEKWSNGFNIKVGLSVEF